MIVRQRKIRSCGTVAAKSCSARREGVQQNAPNKHSSAAKQIGQITSEESEHAAARQRHINQQTYPAIERRAARIEISKRDERGAHHQGQSHDSYKSKAKPKAATAQINH